MQLFPLDSDTNLLPYDGLAFYYNDALPPDQAAFYFDALLKKIEWKQDEAVLYGKHIITKRKTAWYADNGLSYTYSNVRRSGLPWIKELTDLKQVATNITGEVFNACLLNLYHSGEEGMSWHADNEDSIVSYSAIASISLGATRKFSFKHRQTKETISLELLPGSLLLMKGATQRKWLHSLPPSKKIVSPRVNLTFRKMVQ